MTLNRTAADWSAAGYTAAQVQQLRDWLAAAARPAVAVPSDRAWFDPGLLVANLDLTTDVLTQPAGDPILLVGNDPTRVAFWIAGPVGAALAPWSDPLTRYLYRLDATGGIGVTLRTHYSLTCAEWYGVAAAMDEFRVVTLRRN